MPKTSNAIKILDKLIGKDRALRRMVEREEDNLRIAELIYEARTAAGLTQAELAKLVGTKQPVISQLEDADYRGHSLSMLRRVAQALGKRLRIEFVSEKTRRSA
jgi:ribosome-binding protein aMBF1 (putative translation factor)